MNSPVFDVDQFHFELVAGEDVRESFQVEHLWYDHICTAAYVMFSGVFDHIFTFVGLWFGAVDCEISWFGVFGGYEFVGVYLDYLRDDPVSKVDFARFELLRTINLAENKTCKSG